LKISEALKNITFIKEQMWNRLVGVGIDVNFNSYEKIYDMYLDKFGKDDIVRMYEEINQSLSECPIMTD
jgi:hypothetical protein